MSVNIGVPFGTVAEKIKVSDRDRYVSARYYIGCRCFHLYSNYAMHTNDHVEERKNIYIYLSTIRVEARHIRERTRTIAEGRPFLKAINPLRYNSTRDENDSMSFNRQ